ncbi:MAG: PadR family transcriptional regulator [Chloroflexi bacterium]|nr:PadR family transcriptional regulator [Chloroflexota bacterium]
MSPLTRTPLTIEHALLGFLLNGAMHGYDIHRQMMNPQGLGQVWQIKQSQLYALLNRLEQEGFVTTVLEAQESRPPRKMFSLTETGRQTFLQWTSAPVPHGRDMRLDFLVKLFFARQISPNAAETLIELQRETCQQWQLNREDNSPGTFEWLISEFRRGQTDAMLVWLDQCKHFIHHHNPNDF